MWHCRKVTADTRLTFGIQRVQPTTIRSLVVTTPHQWPMSRIIPKPRVAKTIKNCAAWNTGWTRVFFPFKNLAATPNRPQVHANFNLPGICDSTNPSASSYRLHIHLGLKNWILARSFYSIHSQETMVSHFNVPLGLHQATKPHGTATRHHKQNVKTPALFENRTGTAASERNSFLTSLMEKQVPPQWSVFKRQRVMVGH